MGSYNVLQCNEGNKYCCRKALDPENCCGNKSAVRTINVGQLRLSNRARTRTGGAGSSTTLASADCDLAQSGASANKQCPKDKSAVVGGAVGESWERRSWRPWVRLHSCARENQRISVRRRRGRPAEGLRPRI